MLKIPFPYYLSSAEQCRRMDERTIKEFGIDSFTLMEIAGTKAADFILTKTISNTKVLFVCGKGNNAGDALVVARIFSEKNYDCDICFISGTENLSPDTGKNLQLLKKLQGNITILDAEEFPSPDGYDLIVDGMLGTGLDSDVRAPYDEIIEKINLSNTAVFSMDIPTGLHADTGRIMGTAIKASYTITFGALKAGFYLNDGFENSGEVVLCELPFPNQYREKAAVLIDEEWVGKTQTASAQREHKYDGGVVYIIAGSQGLTGAATLTAKSAWSAGVGAVVLITPKGLLDIYEKNLIQIVKQPVGTKDDTHFKSNHIESALNILEEKPGTLLIGPGLGRDKETVEFTQKILAEFEGKVIIDADAIFALSESAQFSKPTAADWILTPHPGELNRLLNSNVDDGFDRLIQSTNFAKSNSVTILSKGFPSIIGTKKGEAFLTGYDTRIFSRAGYGDVLAGKISAYWLNCGNPIIACAEALLEGKRKSEILNNDDHILEPIDLI